MGIYLKATRNIEAGEEILVTYDNHYFTRYKEWTLEQPEEGMHPHPPEPNHPTSNKKKQRQNQTIPNHSWETTTSS